MCVCLMFVFIRGRVGWGLGGRWVMNSRGGSSYSIFRGMYLVLADPCGWVRCVGVHSMYK